MSSIEWVFKIVFFKKLKLVMIAFFMLSYLATIIIIPFLIKFLIDEIILQQKIDILPIWLVLCFLVILAQQVFSFLGEKFLLKLESLKFIHELRQEYTKKIVSLPLEKIRQYQDGGLITRILADIALSGQMAITFPITLIVNLANIIFSIIFLTMLSVPLTLILLTLLPINLLLAELTRNKLESNNLKERQHYDRLLDILKETFVGIKTIKSLRKEKFFCSIFFQELSVWLHVLKNILKITSLLSVIRDFFFQITPFLIMALGAYQIINGKMTLGALTGFLAYIDRMYTPIGNLIQLKIFYLQSKASIQRITEIDAVAKDTWHQPLFDDISGKFELSLKQLSLVYDKALFSVSKNISEGSIVIISGHNGTGKTSLLDMIAGIKKPSFGQVYFYGQPICEYTPDCLKKHIGYCEQIPYIFSGTFENNVVLDDWVPFIRYQKLWQEFGMSQFSLQTNINNHSLSEGEKQKISLIRVFAKDYPIILLDEPTNFLDKSAKEALIKLIQSTKNTTFVIASHDPSLLSIATEHITLTNS